MIGNLAKLSVFAILVLNISTAKADSFFSKVRGQACEKVTTENRSEIRYRAYDKAALNAIKSSFINTQMNNLDEYDFNHLAYKLSDKALNDVTIITTRDDDTEICLELTGILNDKIAQEIISQAQNKNTKDIRKIVDEVKKMPKSMYETDETIPLIFIKDTIYYNHKKTSQYTEKIKNQLSFEPRILITDDNYLADYLIQPKLISSKLENLDNEHQKYSMSVIVEIQRNNEDVIYTETQNRYIIINKDQSAQEIAQKLLGKLIEECLKKLSGKMNALQKY